MYSSLSLSRLPGIVPLVLVYVRAPQYYIRGYLLRTLYARSIAVIPRSTERKLCILVMADQATNFESGMILKGSKMQGVRTGAASVERLQAAEIATDGSERRHCHLEVLI